MAFQVHRFTHNGIRLNITPRFEPDGTRSYLLTKRPCQQLFPFAEPKKAMLLVNEQRRRRAIRRGTYADDVFVNLPQVPRIATSSPLRHRFECYIYGWVPTLQPSSRRRRRRLAQVYDAPKKQCRKRHAIFNPNNPNNPRKSG